MREFTEVSSNGFLLRSELFEQETAPLVTNVVISLVAAFINMRASKLFLRTSCTVFGCTRHNWTDKAPFRGKIEFHLFEMMLVRSTHSQADGKLTSAFQSIIPQSAHSIYHSY